MFMFRNRNRKDFGCNGFQSIAVKAGKMASSKKFAKISINFPNFEGSVYRLNKI